jgi:hypothetical protein
MIACGWVVKSCRKLPGGGRRGQPNTRTSPLPAPAPGERKREKQREIEEEEEREKERERKREGGFRNAAGYICEDSKSHARLSKPQTL